MADAPAQGHDGEINNSLAGAPARLALRLGEVFAPDGALRRRAGPAA